MSMNYDNWERLVAAVIKRQQNWQLCHQLSITTPSLCSEASSVSDFSSSSNYLENNQNPVPKLVPATGVLKEIHQLGKGRFGTSILTELQRGVQVSDEEFIAEGTQLVMKKMRSKVILKVSEEEFSIVFGNCRHQNVAAPRAYYFSVDGNFIFNDYHSRGSVYEWLHGDYYRPNWESRLKIATGAAQGIAHIHEQCGGRLAHGNIKASNIFLNSEQYGCVSDFGLAGITIRPGMWVAGRKNASQESDVYSFGVVLLQLVTGKLPVVLPRGSLRRSMGIVEWALSMRPEDWSSKLFDQSLWSSQLPYHESKSGAFLCDELDMFKYEGLEVFSKIKAEMVEMMQVATRCLATLPQDRPKMFELVLNLNTIFNKPRSRITSKLNCCLLSHYN